jgi:TRAP-type C4-dicarboxylate transport system permease small subunit
MKYFSLVVTALAKGLNWVACGALFGMILIVCANIITRLFGKPIMGTYELVQVSLLIVISFGLAYGSLTGCHTAVELLTRRISGRAQAILGSIICLISTGLFALIAWRCFLLASRFQQANELSITLRIPLYPFLYLVAFNCILVCLVLLLIDLPKELAKGVKK